MDRGEHQAYIGSPEWAARRARFKRDHGYRCVACGSSTYLEVHHVRYDNAGDGREPDRDLRVLCESHHELAHVYEESGHYGAYMRSGTLVRATEAMITDVRAGLVPVPVARPASRTQAARTVSARPARRTDSRRPRGGARRRKRNGGFAWIGTAVIVVLIVVGVNISRSTEPPAQQQPAATTSVVSPVVVPPLPAAAPYVVQAGDTLERIASAAGVTVENLLAWNPAITDRDVIDVGQAVITASPTG